MIHRNIFILMIISISLSVAPVVHAQGNAEATQSQTIEIAETAVSDEEIAARISEIFNRLDELTSVESSVASGVVTLSGMTSTAEAADRAENLATRVEGVVTVENNIERDVSVSTRVAPAIGQMQTFADDAIKLVPLVGLALIVFVAISLFGWLLASWKPFWRKVTPNAFIAELARSTLRAVFVVLAAIAALSLLDAVALLGAFLGAAGVLGLAIGFAVRDTIENYISSVMLSLRQPFRPNDHVVIDGQEGRVVRLTSRATILMTTDGNHLRIPNAAVFKAIILNYTRNPERRFEFELGVDAEDDPLAAIETGLSAINALPFVLSEPPPLSYIKNVGDSNIVIYFAAWINQSNADFAKSRSVALAAAKDALEAEGFALPEPIYRLRFDQSAPAILKGASGITVSENRPEPQTSEQPTRHKKSRDEHAMSDVAPDTHIESKVDAERLENAEEDLLTETAPVE